jgi:hypothetical protein
MGHTCILNQNVASFTTDGGGHGLVHFQFWAHTGETVAWAWIQRGDQRHRQEHCTSDQLARQPGRRAGRLARRPLSLSRSRHRHRLRREDLPQHTQNLRAPALEHRALLVPLLGRTVAIYVKGDGLCCSRSPLD